MYTKIVLQQSSYDCSEETELRNSLKKFGKLTSEADRKKKKRLWLEGMGE